MTADHLDALCVHGLDERIWEATTVQIRNRTDMARVIAVALEAQKAGTALPFVIVDRMSGETLGSTRFHSYVPEHRRIEIGFTWLAPKWQRTGVNAEGKFLLLKHAFEALNCVRVQFHADAENERSRRALERLGAKLEGILRHYRVTAHRGLRDLAVYSILATEWPAIRSRLENEGRDRDRRADRA